MERGIGGRFAGEEVAAKLAVAAGTEEEGGAQLLGRYNLKLLEVFCSSGW